MPLELRWALTEYGSRVEEPATSLPVSDVLNVASTVVSTLTPEPRWLLGILWKARALDHIVLCVNDVAETRRFYERVLGMESRQERSGKWLGFRPQQNQPAGPSDDIQHCA